MYVLLNFILKFIFLNKAFIAFITLITHNFGCQT